MLIETKPFRTDPKRKQLREKLQQAGRERKGRKGKPWLPAEGAYLERNWLKHGDTTLAARLSQLPCNVERGVVRTRKAVKNRRYHLGLRRTQARGKGGEYMRLS